LGYLPIDTEAHRQDSALALLGTATHLPEQDLPFAHNSPYDQQNGGVTVAPELNKGARRMDQQLQDVNLNNETVCRQSFPLPPAARNGEMSDQTNKSRIRLVLLDSYGLFRAILARFLAAEPDLEVVGECGTFAEALDILARQVKTDSKVDLVLLDFDVGTEHGTDFISAARQTGYQGRFLIVAGSVNLQSSAIALKLGASGIFLKSEAPDRLVRAIRLAEEDGIWVDKRIIQLLADQSIDHHPRSDNAGYIGSLPDLERNVLQGIVDGHTNRKIGESIAISESKVKNVVQKLFGRAGVKTRGQLVRAALEGSLGSAQKTD